MGIYDGVVSNESLEISRKQQESAEFLKRLINQNFRALCEIYKSGFEIINSNPFGLTKEQVIGALDPADWAKFYTEAVMLKALINHVKPGTIEDAVGEQG
jgi:hypothetical protein